MPTPGGLKRAIIFRNCHLFGDGLRGDEHGQDISFQTNTWPCKRKNNCSPTLSQMQVFKITGILFFDQFPVLPTKKIIVLTFCISTQVFYRRKITTNCFYTLIFSYVNVIVWFTYVGYFFLLFYISYR